MQIRPTCLIVSTADDLHVRKVIDHLDAATVPFVLNLSEFGTKYGASLSSDIHPALQLRTADGDVVSFERLSTVWWRRPQPFPVLQPSDPTLKHFVAEEYLRFWQSSLAALAANNNVKWYNHYKQNQLADCKFRQLQIAKEVGIVVPKTLVTNSPCEALEFVKGLSYKAIFKSFSGNDSFWQPTRKYESNYDELLKKHLGYCPVIFQQYVSGIADHRIVMIDDRAFDVRFNISASRYPFDVRIDTAVSAEMVEIKEDLRLKLIDFMRCFKIRYGAFDLRETQDGNFVLFEVNPAGQFLYLDHLVGSRISEAMASALSSSLVSIMDSESSAVEGSSCFYVGSTTPFAAAVPDRVGHLE